MTSASSDSPVPANRYRDGAPWELVAGYSRAARAGSFIAVSGTTAPAGAERFPGDTYGQVRAALAKVVEAVEALGGSRSDIIRPVPLGYQ